MQKKPQTEELPLDRYEDPADMLDHIYEKLDHAIYLWVVWAKTFGSGEEQDALKAILSEIVTLEYDSLFKAMKVNITADKHGTPQINACVPKDFS